MRQSVVATAFLLLLLALEQGCMNRCDPVRVMDNLFDATEAADLDRGVSYFTSDATITTWAEGVNGRHWEERTYAGADQIRSVLTHRGFRRTPVEPNGPGFQITDLKVSLPQVSLWLRPDRLSPDKKQYDPYHIAASFANCRITKMTVMEFLSWE